MSGREDLRGEQDARATIKVPTHRATPPPPLQVSGLLKRIGKKLTLKRGKPCDNTTITLYGLPDEAASQKAAKVQYYHYAIWIVWAKRSTALVGRLSQRRKNVTR